MDSFVPIVPDLRERVRESGLECMDDDSLDLLVEWEKSVNGTVVDRNQR